VLHPTAPLFTAATGVTWPSSFEAINMAVIPNGAPNETVIVWDKLNYYEIDNILGTPIGVATNWWRQRFSVGNPETNTWKNYVITMPSSVQGSPVDGDLFCAGHTWLPDGRLFVAGGNSRYGIQPVIGAVPGWGTPIPSGFLGSRFAGIWDPTAPRVAPDYGWTWLPPMKERRWYPTCTLLGDGRVMVAGGSQDSPNNYCVNGQDPAFNTYEVFVPSTGLGATGYWESPAAPAYRGPAAGCGSVLGEYPRMHLLSNNKVFMSGQWSGANRVWHDLTYVPASTSLPLAKEYWDGNPPLSTPTIPATPNWPIYAHPQGGSARSCGASVLVPNVGNGSATDRIMTLGGVGYPNGNPVPILMTEWIAAAQLSPAWQPSAIMGFARECLSAVLLPDGGILAIGGGMNGYGANVAAIGPALNPELFYPAFPAVGWRTCNPQASSRVYHSTAALLPSGKVVSSGGDVRVSDHEVFTPPYLIGTARPVLQGTFAGPGSALLSFDTTYFIDCDPGSCASLKRIVLMRPCSVTHHSDFDQRYVELRPMPWPKNVPVDDTIGMWVRTPATPVTGSLQSRVEAPPGYYMMFLISDQDVPSVAKWVKLQ
jgi:hypothetical protein